MGANGANGPSRRPRNIPAFNVEVVVSEMSVLNMMLLYVSVYLIIGMYWD